MKKRTSGCLHAAGGGGGLLVRNASSRTCSQSRHSARAAAAGAQCQVPSQMPHKQVLACQLPRARNMVHLLVTK